MAINEQQLNNLIHLAGVWVRELEVEATCKQLSEEAFTRTVLLPWLQSQVEGLNKRDLYVRGDGGPSVHPLPWDGLLFYPDLTVVSMDEKYIAFEVKFLRGKGDKVSDPSGALTKAIGQVAIYSSLGYEHSFGLIFDLRNASNATDKLRWNQEMLRLSNSEVHVYR